MAPKLPPAGEPPRRHTALALACLAASGLAAGTATWAQSHFNEWQLTRENFEICKDSGQPLPKRATSCNRVIDHGGLPNSKVAKVYAMLGQAFLDSSGDQSALRNFNAPDQCGSQE